MPRIETPYLKDILAKKISNFEAILKYMQDNQINLFSIELLCNQKLNFLRNYLKMLEFLEEEETTTSFSELMKIAE